MTSVHIISDPISDVQRRKMIFDGHILIFRKVQKLIELCAFADKLIREAFGSLDPETAHEHLDGDEFIATVDALQRRYTNNNRTKELTNQALIDLGLDEKKTGRDWTPLRIQPPVSKSKHVDRPTTGLGVHRDSWYANLHQQTNWWMPIYPLEHERSLVFYPQYWSRPIKNNTKGWNLQEWRAKRKQMTEAGEPFNKIKEACPGPHPDEPIDVSEGMSFIIDPGDILNFSAAAVHGGATNTSKVARFSTEIRTVHADDLKTEAGCHNIDGESTGSALVDFYTMTDERPIQEIVT